jgi:O-antigen ligase
LKHRLKNIPHFYLFTLFAGTLFFIPDIFVNRFITAPGLWMQAGISIGIIGYILLRKKQTPLPPMVFILLLAIWAIYHIWQSWRNLENLITIISLIAVFFLCYAIWSHLKNKKSLFTFFSFLALALSLWGIVQLIGQFPSYNDSFAITGPFDNPAGISTSLVVLFPFSLYFCCYSERKYRLLAIIVAILVVTVIILSQARTAIASVSMIFIFFLIRVSKVRGVKVTPFHYIVISGSFLLLLASLFFLKKDSAIGRLLIWQCSSKLIVEKPIFGYGSNGFTANYMNEQAAYFTKYQESRYVNLADNIRHPFNEFLKWTVNYGVAGLCITLFLIIIPLWISRKRDSTKLFFIRLSLLSIGICALFSYPFNYPFPRLMTVALLAFILSASPQQSITISNGYLPKGIAILFSMSLLSATACLAFHEREWYKVAHRALRGETHQMLPRYKLLYTRLYYKDLFLYNYAAELNVAGHYYESQQIARKCEKLWADFDLQMLMVDNYLQLQQYTEAINYLEKAAAMCPVKFIPLYRLTELYLETGQKEKARILAQKILDKKVKVPSPVIDRIKSKMRKLLDEPDSFNDPSYLINQNMKLITILS